MARRQQPLTREEIMQAALELIDREGLAGFSMRKLAAALKVEAMSLYNHVEGKNDLLHGVINRLLEQIPQPETALSWQETVRFFVISLYNAFVARPDLAPLLELGEPLSPKVLRGVEQVLCALQETGLNPNEQVSAFRGLVAMSMGFVLAHTQGLTSSKADAETVWARWDSGPMAASGLPHLVELTPHFVSTNADDAMRFMLGAFIAALEARASQKNG